MLNKIDKIVFTTALMIVVSIPLLAVIGEVLLLTLK